jgi:hypothetical protein
MLTLIARFFRFYTHSMYGHSYQHCAHARIQQFRWTKDLCHKFVGVQQFHSYRLITWYILQLVELLSSFPGQKIINVLYCMCLLLLGLSPGVASHIGTFMLCNKFCNIISTVGRMFYIIIHIAYLLIIRTFVMACLTFEMVIYVFWKYWLLRCEPI